MIHITCDAATLARRKPKPEVAEWMGFWADTNYVVMQGEINIAIGDAPPISYFSALRDQCECGEARYGGITDAEELCANLQAHCIPAGMEEADVDDYDGFLKQRRLLMASKIRDYYGSL